MTVKILRKVLKLSLDQELKLLKHWGRNDTLKEGLEKMKARFCCIQLIFSRWSPELQ